MSKLPSPLHSKSPDSLYVCGKFLKKGSPIVVDSSLITDAVKDLAERKVIIIRDSGPGKSQLLRM
jgi:hypothetical protein